MLGKQRLQPQYLCIIMLQLLLQGVYLTAKFSILAIKLCLELTNGV
jgi:hypothetical protein